MSYPLDDGTLVDGQSLTRGPLYLKIKFDPADLPPGTVDLQDISHFLMGLQEITEGIISTEFESLEAAKDQKEMSRFVIVERRSSSYEVIITFQAILDAIGNGFAQALINPAVWEGVATIFLGAFATKAGGMAGADAYKRLGKLVVLTRDVIHRRWNSAIDYLRPETGKGLKQIAKVMSKSVYRNKPISITTDVPYDTPQKLDRLIR